MSTDIMACKVPGPSGDICDRLVGHGGDHLGVNGTIWPGGIRVLTCYQIECTECGTEFYESADIDGIPHYPSPEAALEMIQPCDGDCSRGAIYLHRRGDEVLCVSCAHEADCADSGHRYGEWHSEHLTRDGKRWRTCDYCGDFDVEPATSPEATKGGGEK